MRNIGCLRLALTDKVFNVGWLAPGDQWDTTMVADLLEGTLYPHGLKFRNWAGYPRTGGAAIVCPGRYWAGHEAEISSAISFYDWCLLIVTSDEEATFDCSNVLHDNICFWVQTPRKDHQYPAGTRFLGVGYTPHMRSLPVEPPGKGWDVFLSGQRTHIRRQEAFQALENHPNSLVFETSGFTQGMNPDVYRSEMLAAKMAPCPSGAVSPDSFRAWEALEAHCVPILDAVSPVDGDTDYWEQVLPGCPAPVLREYADLPGYVEDALKAWPSNANRITAYYMRYKRGLARGLRDDLQALGAL
jgi:hypothetical protein